MSAGPPAVVVGIGAFGARVARRLADECAEAGGGPLATVLADPPGDAAAVADAVMARVREALAHDRLVAARDAAGEDGLPRMHVLVLAHLGEDATRALVAAALRAVEERLLAELGPIFESFRAHAARNGVLLPLLAMPHPAAHPRGADVAAAVRELARRVAGTSDERRAVPQFYLIEDVAEYSVLSPVELEQCVRNFATLILRELPALGDRATRLVYGAQPREPIATFACAVAELPRARLRAYAVNRVALDLLDAVAGDGAPDVTIADADALADVEVAALDWKDTAEQDAREVVTRYKRPPDRDPEPPWYERGEDVRERYGADPGDPSLDAAQGPADPPRGWALRRMEEVEAAWKTLQRGRFDDVVDRDTRRVTAARDALLESIARRVDRELWADPTPQGFRRASEVVAKLRREFEQRLATALRDRDEVSPAPPPTFDAFRAAHARLLDEARRKPDLGRMVLWGLLFALAAMFFAPPLLALLADALGVPRAEWYSALMREKGWATSLVGALLYAGLALGARYRAAVLRLREAYGGMWDALERTLVGASDSLVAYFASRLRLARAIARVEALLAVVGALERDAERLTLADKAARRGRAALLDAQRALGVVRRADGSDDVTALLDPRREVLVEPLVGAAGAEELARVLPDETRDARVRDLLRVLAADHGAAARWRDEIPFARLDVLRAAAAPHARPLAEWDPFAKHATAEATARHLAAFVRRQARSLRVALNYTGHEFRDATGTTTVLDGEALVPAAAVESVRALLAAEGAAGRTTIAVRAGLEPDRAYYVVAECDIAEDAVRSLHLGPLPAAEPPPPPPAPLAAPPREAPAVDAPAVSSAAPPPREGTS